MDIYPLDMSSSTVQYTVATAAAAAGVSEKTIRRWIGSGRLVARELEGAYQIDADDLQKARDGVIQDMQDTVSEVLNGDQQTYGSLPLPAQRALARPAGSGDLAAMLTQAIGEAVTAPLYDRLERQATRIGELETQLSIATTPKTPRPSRPRGPSRPRVSVPADDAEEAMRKLAKTFDPAELARIARRLGKT